MEWPWDFTCTWCEESPAGTTEGSAFTKQCCWGPGCQKERWGWGWGEAFSLSPFRTKPTPSAYLGEGLMSNDYSEEGLSHTELNSSPQYIWSFLSSFCATIDDFGKTRKLRPQEKVKTSHLPKSITGYHAHCHLVKHTKHPLSLCHSPATYRWHSWLIHFLLQKFNPQEAASVRPFLSPQEELCLPQGQWEAGSPRACTAEAWGPSSASWQQPRLAHTSPLLFQCTFHVRCAKSLTLTALIFISYGENQWLEASACFLSKFKLFFLHIYPFSFSSPVQAWRRAEVVLPSPRTENGPYEDCNGSLHSKAYFQD